MTPETMVSILWLIPVGAISFLVGYLHRWSEKDGQ